MGSRSRAEDTSRWARSRATPRLSSALRLRYAKFKLSISVLPAADACTRWTCSQETPRAPVSSLTRCHAKVSVKKVEKRAAVGLPSAVWLTICFRPGIRGPRVTRTPLGKPLGKLQLDILPLFVEAPLDDGSLLIIELDKDPLFVMAPKVEERLANKIADADRLC